MLAVPGATSLLQSIPDLGRPSLSGNLQLDSHLGLTELSLLLLSVAPKISIKGQNLSAAVAGEPAGLGRDAETGKRPQSARGLCWRPQSALVSPAAPHRAPAAFRNRCCSAALLAYANQERKSLRHLRNNKRGEIKSGFSAPCAQVSGPFSLSSLSTHRL